MTPKEYADKLHTRFWSYVIFEHTNIETANEWAKNQAILCCKEVLGYTGADRGYEFWTSVLYELEHYEK